MMGANEVVSQLIHTSNSQRNLVLLFPSCASTLLTNIIENCHVDDLGIELGRWKHRAARKDWICTYCDEGCFDDETHGLWSFECPAMQVVRLDARQDNDMSDEPRAWRAGNWTLNIDHHHLIMTSIWYHPHIIPIYSRWWWWLEMYVLTALLALPELCIMIRAPAY